MAPLEVFLGALKPQQMTEVFCTHELLSAFWTGQFSRGKFKKQISSFSEVGAMLELDSSMHTSKYSIVRGN